MRRSLILKVAILGMSLTVLSGRSAKSLTASESQALRGCIAWQKAIGSHGTTSRKVLLEANKVIVVGMPMTTERQPVGAKIITVERGRFYGSCQTD